ncbi:hypothetical protein [Microbacterium sp. NPDC087868]|uniref:hypothetical protein n=1 Tax=Microbacterium sp. NPDC087868 TaxID=3364195 RepID=UPI00384E3D36
MSNPEGLINSFGAEESAIRPEEEDLIEEEHAESDDEVSAEERIAGQDAIGGGVNTDPDLGLASSPSDISAADLSDGNS